MTQNQLTDIFGIEKHGLDHWTLENVLDQFFGPIFLDYFLVHC